MDRSSTNWDWATGTVAAVCSLIVHISCTVYLVANAGSLVAAPFAQMMQRKGEASPGVPSMLPMGLAADLSTVSFATLILGLAMILVAYARFLFPPRESKPA